MLWQLLYLRTILYIVHYEPVALVEPQLSLVWRWRWSGVECHWHPGAWPVVTPTTLNEFAFYSETRPLLLCFSHTPGEDQPYRSSSSVVPPLSHPHQHLKLSSFQASQRNTVDSTILGLVISLRSLPHPLVRTNESHCRQSGEQSWLHFAFLILWTTRKISESRTR